MASGIGWVTVDQVVAARLRDGLAECLAAEQPVNAGEQRCGPRHLVDDPRNVGRRKSCRFAAERHIEPAAEIETNHAVETRPVEKQVIVGVWPGRAVEPLAYGVVVSLANLAQRLSFGREVLAYAVRTDPTSLDCRIEPDQVRVGVAQ